MTGVDFRIRLPQLPQRLVFCVSFNVVACKKTKTKAVSNMKKELTQCMKDIRKEMNTMKKDIESMRAQIRTISKEVDHNKKHMNDELTNSRRNVEKNR